MLLSQRLTCLECDGPLGFEVNFCPYCGTARVKSKEEEEEADALPEMVESVQVSPPVVVGPDDEPTIVDPEIKAPAARHRWMIFAAVVGCILFAGVGGVMLWPRPNPPESKPPSRTDFSIGHPKTIEDLMRQAHVEIEARQISNAQVLLRQAKDYPYNYAPALLELAHLDDPNQCPEFYRETAHPTMAARYYKEADAKGVTSAHEDREKLRDFLEKQAEGSGSEAYVARAALQAYWP